jgi:hypothetical protein
VAGGSGRGAGDVADADGWREFPFVSYLCAQDFLLTICLPLETKRPPTSKRLVAGSGTAAVSTIRR